MISDVDRLKKMLYFITPEGKKLGGEYQSYLKSINNKNDDGVILTEYVVTLGDDNGNEKNVVVCVNNADEAFRIARLVNASDNVGNDNFFTDRDIAIYRRFNNLVGMKRVE